MSNSTVVARFGLAAGVALLLGLSGCSSSKPALYDHENFDDAGTYSRNYPVSDAASCEAARRALLSQGYIITSTDPKLVAGHKSFQQTGDTHMEISFNIVCASDNAANHSSTVFANALLDRYALKKTNQSASLGVGVLGSVSMPIGSSDDSMVKVASETVASDTFYDRYFALVENFLPPEAKKAAHIPEKPGNELGVPEPAPAKAAAKPAQPVSETPPAAAAAAVKAPEPAAVADPTVQSEPLTPPAESKPIEAAPLILPVEPAASPAPAALATPATPQSSAPTTP